MCFLFYFSHADTSVNQLTLCAVTALTSGVMAFTCGSLVATICNFATNQRKKVRNKASRCMPTLSLHREQSPLYDDIIQMQNYCQVHHRENNPYVSPVSTPTYETIKLCTPIVQEVTLYKSVYFANLHVYCNLLIWKTPFTHVLCIRDMHANVKPRP